MYAILACFNKSFSSFIVAVLVQLLSKFTASEKPFIWSWLCDEIIKLVYK